MNGVSRKLPIFPLPQTVLFPETSLPLHVFEPRYRELLADTLEGDRIMGIQTLNPGGPADANGRPSLLTLGCAGEVVEHEQQDDGRSKIVLRGLFRYRITSELDSERSYRLVLVEELPILPLGGQGPDDRREKLRSVLSQVVERLAKSVGRTDAGVFPADLSDEGLVNEAVERLGLEADDRYRLLSMNGLEERYRWVLEHIAGVQGRLDLLSPYRRDLTSIRWN